MDAKGNITERVSWALYEKKIVDGKETGVLRDFKASVEYYEKILKYTGLIKNSSDPAQMKKYLKIAQGIDWDNLKAEDFSSERISHVFFNAAGQANSLEKSIEYFNALLKLLQLINTSSNPAEIKRYMKIAMGLDWDNLKAEDFYSVDAKGNITERDGCASTQEAQCIDRPLSFNYGFCFGVKVAFF